MWGEVLRSTATINACFGRTAQPRNQSEHLIPLIGQVFIQWRAETVLYTSADARHWNETPTQMH